MIAVKHTKTGKFLPYFNGSFNKFYWRKKYELFEYPYELTDEEKQKVFTECFTAKLNVDKVKIFTSAKGAKISLGKHSDIEFVELFLVPKNSETDETK